MVGEVEVKARVDGRDEVAERILALGGRFVREVTQEDLYFKHPCYDLRGKDEALRLRREEERFTLTFKGRRIGSGAKMREEVEVEVGDFGSMATLLKKAGFEESFVIKKNRRIYSFEGAEVSLDSVEGLGEFVEIELMLADGNMDELNSARTRDSLRETLHGIAEKLQVPRERLTTESYLELLASESSRSKASK